jgi:hypothetical protein
MQDLNDHPEIWRLVQQDRTGRAFAEHDAVELRGPDYVVFA